MWNERVVPAAKVAAHPRLNRTRGIGQKLAARLREHGRDQVALVLRWYAQSPDDRARFLRDGRYELGTLMRPEKFDGYLAFALDWKRRGSPLATGPPAGELLGLNRHTWRETRSDGERAEAERRAQEALPELQELLAKRTKEAG